MITLRNKPQSVGLLWTSDQPYTDTSTWQHTTLTTQTDIHVPSQIRTHDLSRRAAADPRLRPHGLWDRLFVIYARLISEIICLFSWRYNPLSLYFSQPGSGLYSPRFRGFLTTHNDAPQSVGLLWTRDESVAETSIWQHTTTATEKHPCPPVGFEPTISEGERP